jgi:hypothetical protein
VYSTERFTLAELKDAGFVDGLKAAGFELDEVAKAGYSFENMRAGGYVIEDLFHMGYMPYECSLAGFTYGQGRQLGFVGEEYDWVRRVLACAKGRDWGWTPPAPVKKARSSNERKAIWFGLGSRKPAPKPEPVVVERRWSEDMRARVDEWLKGYLEAEANRGKPTGAH